MKAWLIAGAVALAAAQTLALPARAEGPRPSSENHWPGIQAVVPATEAPSVEAEGPRPSSENRWPGIVQTAPTVAAAATAPHYAWQEGYDRGGKWHGHWILVQ